MPDYYPDEHDDRDGEEEFPDVEAEFRTGGSGIEYHCSEQELAEGGLADGVTVRDLHEMPEHESEFAAPEVIGDPLDYLEAPYGEHLRGPLQMLLDGAWRCDQGEPRGVRRLARVLRGDWPSRPLRASS